MHRAGRRARRRRGRARVGERGGRGQHEAPQLRTARPISSRARRPSVSGSTPARSTPSSTRSTSSRGTGPRARTKSSSTRARGRAGMEGRRHRPDLHAAAEGTSRSSASPSTATSTASAGSASPYSRSPPLRSSWTGGAVRRDLRRGGRGCLRGRARRGDRADPARGRKGRERDGGGQEQTDEVNEFLRFFRYFLLAFAGVALFVGAFVIFNTLSITVAQRTREFATCGRSAPRDGRSSGR